MRRNTLILSLAALAAMTALLLTSSVLARFRFDGAGGCGNFAEGVATAVAGDVLGPMRGGVNTQSTVITKTVVIQGGWIPVSGDCNSNGTDTYTDQASALSAGFAFDSTQRSELFGGFGGEPTLPISLTNRTLVLQHLQLDAGDNTVSGTAIGGTLTGGARLRIENVGASNNTVGGSNVGGAIFLTVSGGSSLVIADSVFEQNQAGSGGAIELLVEGGSTVVIEGNSFINNEALSGDGGAIRVVMRHGYLVIRDNSFSGNIASNGSGPAIRVERAANADGPTTVKLERNTGAGGANTSLSGVSLLSPRAFMPLLWRSPSGSGYGVTITAITLSDARYAVSFTASGYTPALPGRHVHFFFDTVPPDQAGAPGAGPWFMYGGGSPFTGYGIVDRPPGATRLCALVANSDHSVIQGTGNCLELP